MVELKGNGSLPRASSPSPTGSSIMISGDLRSIGDRDVSRGLIGSPESGKSTVSTVSSKASIRSLGTVGVSAFASRGGALAVGDVSCGN